jgi:hypothetical protein
MAAFPRQQWQRVSLQPQTVSSPQHQNHLSLHQQGFESSRQTTPELTLPQLQPGLGQWRVLLVTHDTVVSAAPFSFQEPNSANFELNFQGN